jgi:hypothetical protein
MKFRMLEGKSRGVLTFFIFKPFLMIIQAPSTLKKIAAKILIQFLNN